MEIKGIEGISKFLTEAGTFYLATADGDQPKTRPMGFQMLYNGKLYFGAGKHKRVYAQMLKNPKVEICAFKGSDIVRYYGKAVVDDDPELFEAARKAFPFLDRIYNEQTGLKLAIFSLEDAKAEWIDMVDYDKKEEIEL